MKRRKNLILLSIFIFIIGLAIGSFLNVCIYRLPCEESLFYPPSHCPECGSSIRWFDNIPLISYLLLKGKCRSCKKPISFQYPSVEAVTGFLFLFAFLRYFLNSSIIPIFPLLKDLFLISFLIPIFFIDLKHQIIPNSLSYPLIISGVILSFLQRTLLSSAAGIGIGGGALFLIYFIGSHLLKEESMGMGDIKLSMGIGAFLGGEKTLLFLFLSFIIGGIFAAIFLLLHLKKKRERIPFAPFLTVSALISIFFGDKLIYLYLNSFFLISILFSCKSFIS